MRRRERQTRGRGAQRDRRQVHAPPTTLRPQCATRPAAGTLAAPGSDPRDQGLRRHPLPAELTRFPRSRIEGDIPAMALVTSHYDPEECILQKIGIDDSEFTLPSQPGRVHLFFGTGTDLGPATPSGGELWSDVTVLDRYDMVLLTRDHPSASRRAGFPIQAWISHTTDDRPRRRSPRARLFPIGCS